jgi:3-dehydroquinate synthase
MVNVNTVTVSLRRVVDDSYTVSVGSGLLSAPADRLGPLRLPRRVAVVSDETVFRLHGAAFVDALAAAGFDVAVKAVFPAGESSKTRETKAWVEDRLLEARLGRDSWIAALGGGVVGDLAGFTAATYLRGIPFVQFPTTLLAMADSSVGGKTGIDTVHGKNLVGAFWQPKAVIADVDLLQTLSDEHFREGLAETIKHAVIADADFLAHLERALPQIVAREAAALIPIVVRNCEIKAGVVEADEREGDLRKILNYGHTLGHALEAAAEYALLHGACVSLGMRYEGRLARELGLWSEADAQRVEALLDAAGFAKLDALDVSSDILVELTAGDKKARGGKAEYVLPEKPGAMHRGADGYGLAVDAAVVTKVLRGIRGR